jgi:hypothetical protein
MFGQPARFGLGRGQMTPEQKLKKRVEEMYGAGGFGGRNYYRQYLNDLPQYQTQGQGSYTGPGTDAFHPLYGRASSQVLSTPLPLEQESESGKGLINVRDFIARGQSGYDPYSMMGGIVPEFPKYGGKPYSYGGYTGESPAIIDIDVPGSERPAEPPLFYQGGERASKMFGPIPHGGFFNLGDLLTMGSGNILPDYGSDGLGGEVSQGSLEPDAKGKGLGDGSSGDESSETSFIYTY